MKKLMALLVIIVFASGCVDIFDSNVKFTGEPIKMGKDAVIDILVIENKIVEPPTILQEDEFSVYFNVVNRGETLDEKLEDVSVSLYDWGVCTYDDSSVLKKDAGSEMYTTSFSLSPGAEERIDIDMKAPDTDVNLVSSVECPMKFKAEFKGFIAKTPLTGVEAISSRRLESLGGRVDSTPPKQHVGIGPVKIYYEFHSYLPVREERQISFSIWVENKGSGDKGKISIGDLNLWVPASFDFQEGDCSKLVTKVTEEIGGMDYYKFENSKELTLVKGTTEKMRCFFNAPELDDIPTKTYDFYTELIYNYEIHDSVPATVKKVD